MATIEIRVHGVSGTLPREMLGGEAERDPDAPGDVWRRAGEDTGVRAVRWSNLTSGSPVSALWLTLLPYMLLNVAGWALPPMGRVRLRLAVTMVRLTGLALTAIFSMITAIGFLGVGGYQVLGPRIGAGRALVAGVAASVLVVVGLWASTSRVGERSAADRPHLRPLHVAMGLWSVWWVLYAAVTEASAGVVVLPTGGVEVTWPVPVLIGSAVIASGLLDKVDRVVQATGNGLLLVAAGVLAVDTVATLLAPIGAGDRLRSLDDPLKTIVAWFTGLGLAAVLLALSRAHRHSAAAVGSLVALAGSTGASVGAALIWAAATLTRTRPPSGIAPIAAAFMTGSVLVGLVGAVVFAAKARRATPAARAILETVVAVRDGAFPVLVAIPAVTAGMTLVTLATLGTPQTWPGRVTAGAATVAAVALAAGLARTGLHRAAVVPPVLAGIGWTIGLATDLDFELVAVVFTLALPLIVVVTRIWGAMGDRDRRRTLAVPWDVGSFFARRYHPFAPPTYRDRAVEDLKAAVEHFRSAGVGVILGGHSQGTVVVAATVAEGAGPVTVLTYGSPLGSLYRRYFPRHFTPEYLETVRAASRRWINLWRPTDPISGPVSPGPDDRRIEDIRLRGHGGYWLGDEPEYARAVDELSAVPSDP